MSTKPRTVNGYEVRSDGGEINDDELHRYLNQMGPLRTRDLQEFFHLPRTSVWTSLKRLQQRGLVERAVPPRRGISAVWQALPPEWDQMAGEQFADWRSRLNISQSRAHEELTHRVEDAPAQSTLSKFENGKYDLSSECRRALYNYYSEEESR